MAGAKTRANNEATKKTVFVSLDTKGKPQDNEDKKNKEKIKGKERIKESFGFETAARPKWMNLNRRRDGLGAI